MKTTLLLFASLITGLAHAQTFDYLDINQVKARVNAGGDLHYDSTYMSPTYQCPIGSNKNWGGLGSLWIGGLDIGGQLKLAAQTYHQGGVDYWPGPLSTVDATTNSSVVNQYKRVWKINKSDIDLFLVNVANGNVQNGTFTIPNSILNWPGNGDISQNQDQLLAPFMDVDGDNVYTPSAGDYPLIKGDQAIFTVYNDNYLPHGSGGAALGLEIRLMAYAFGPCTITSSNPFLNYTTFYNYQIINRSAFAFLDVYANLFTDIDMSLNATSPNDYAGCDVQDGYAYNYNSQFANNPAIGVVQLKGPINTHNSIDDNGDGMIDEPFENMGMTNFMYTNNSLPGVALPTTDPANAAQHYQYMTGFWRDGTPLTCGGNGYGGSTPTKFAYPGNTYPTGPCGSSNWSETGTGSDKRLLIGSGPFILQPGAVNYLEYAYISSFDSITNNPLNKLEQDVQALKAIYNTTLNQCLTTGVKEENLNNSDFNISPNPTNGLLTINSSKINTLATIEVIDALGKVLLAEDYKEFSSASINIGDLSCGIYFIKITSGHNTITKKIIKN
ncbi:MAG: T9SS type A sorting domain-containing protein [Bacteroidota bacterium]